MRILDLDNLPKKSRSSQWERIKNDPIKLANYKKWRKQNNLKKRQKAAGLLGSNSTAIVYAPQLRRESILTEIVNQLYSVDWADNELRNVWTVLQNLRELLPTIAGGNGKGAVA